MSPCCNPCHSILTCIVTTIQSCILIPVAASQALRIRCFLMETRLMRDSLRKWLRPNRIMLLCIDKYMLEIQEFTGRRQPDTHMLLWGRQGSFPFAEIDDSIDPCPQAPFEYDPTFTPVWMYQTSMPMHAVGFISVVTELLLPYAIADSYGKLSNNVFLFLDYHLNGRSISYISLTIANYSDSIIWPYYLEVSYGINYQYPHEFGSTPDDVRIGAGEIRSFLLNSDIKLIGLPDTHTTKVRIITQDDVGRIIINWDFYFGKAHQ